MNCCGATDSFAQEASISRRSFSSSVSSRTKKLEAESMSTTVSLGERLPNGLLGQDFGLPGVDQFDHHFQETQFGIVHPLPQAVERLRPLGDQPPDALGEGARCLITPG